MCVCVCVVRLVGVHVCACGIRELTAGTRLAPQGGRRVGE